MSRISQAGEEFSFQPDKGYSSSSPMRKDSAFITIEYTPESVFAGELSSDSALLILPVCSKVRTMELNPQY
jgi:hypothetical protein